MCATDSTTIVSNETIYSYIFDNLTFNITEIRKFSKNIF